jgi:hypothetical protein
VRLRCTRASVMAAPRRASPWALDLDFTTGVLDPRVSFSRASPAWHFNSAGVLVQAAANAPRFAFDPVTLQPLGLQMEAVSRTNICPQAHTNGRTVIETPIGILAPEVGSTLLGLSSTRITSNGAASGHFAGVAAPLSIASSTVHTLSVYCRPVVGSLVQIFASSGFTDGYVNVDLSTGAVTDSGGGAVALVPQSCGNGVWRVGFTFTSKVGATVGSSCAVSFIPSGTSTRAPSSTATGTLDFAGVQLEAGGTASSLIPTAGAAVTYAGDIAVMTGVNFSSWWNPSLGTVLTESIGPATFADFPAIACVGNGTAPTEEMSLYVANDSRTRFEVKSQSGAVQGLLVGGMAAAGAVRKSAFAWQANDFAFSSNGGAAVTDSSGLVPVVDRLSFASFVARGGGGGPSGQFIRRFRYSPTRMTNEQLQQLTA